MFSSLSAKPAMWGAILRDIERQCQAMAQDMTLASKLEAEARYFRVHYEDLVDDTAATIAEIYAFLGVPYGKYERESVFNHTNTNPSKANSYFSTFRGADFAHDTWKTSLKLEVGKKFPYLNLPGRQKKFFFPLSQEIRSIESGCREVMAQLNYKIFDPTEKNAQD